MSTSVAPSPAEPASRREVVTVTAAMLAAYAIMGFAVRGGALFFRPLWLDEWHTLFIARLESLNAVIHALARGADFNPPLLFVVQWLFAQAMGDASAWQLRLVAMLSIWGTLATLFVLLRGSFRLVPALVGVIAVGMNVNVIVHAFEGRFYGPWMLLTVVFIALVTRAVEAPRSLSRQIAACISAALLCLIHYFGIITLGLILIAVVSVWRPLRGAIAGVLPSALSAGLTCLALLPLFLGQRSALSVATWVPPASFFLVAYFLIPAVLILSAAWFILPPLLVRRAGAALLPLQQARVAALASVAALPLVRLGVRHHAVGPRESLCTTVVAGARTCRGWRRDARVERRVALVMAVATGLTWVIAGVQQAGVSTCSPTR
ncbi:MAG: glycosyltransferase family 39 protein [Gemmatimonadaceae bacterium]